MDHAISPSLISLRLTSDSSEGSSLRWGLAASGTLHAIVIVLAMFIKFQSESQQPLRAIEVALISLPAVSTATPSSKPAPPKPPIATKPPKKIVPPKPQPVAQAEPQPQVAPVEDPLPPLPTTTAAERLSESLGGAINSIVVPDKRETSPTATPRNLEPQVQKEQGPLIDKLQLPSAAPTIARPQRLQQAKPLKIPSLPTPQPTTPPTPETHKAPQPPQQPSPALPSTARPKAPLAPTVPSLKEVTPFETPQKATTTAKVVPPPDIEDSIKRSLPNVRIPAPTPDVPRVSREKRATISEPMSSTPTVSAPKLERIPKTSPPVASKPAPPKMSETVKKLMEGLKSTTRTSAPRTAPPPRVPKPKTPVATPAPTPVPTEIDQRIAKLSIPDVAPVESIKQRLQLLNLPASTGGPPGSMSQASPGKNRYLAMVEARIDQQWVAPPLVASTPLVVLKFRIARSGEVSRIHIAESSGHAHYDSAAQRAVQAVNPLPPFPKDISDSFFDVQYRFIKD